MYDFFQIGAKLIIIAAIFIIAVYSTLRVWRMDLDLWRLLSPGELLERGAGDQLSWLPSREQDAIYQTGKLVARVSEPKVDEAHATINFSEIYNSNPLDENSEFEFGRWRLKLRSYRLMVGLNVSAPQKGRIFYER